MKICLNCGDKLLDAAKKCPTCGKNVKDCPIVDPNDKVNLNQIIQNVPNPKEDQPGFFAQMLAQEDAKRAVKRELKARLDAEGVAYCPKCLSTSLSAHKKGFGVGKAAVGGLVAGPLGLVAGNIGAKKIRVTCLKCGHQFWAGK